MKKLLTALFFGAATIPFVSAQTGADCLGALPFCTGTNYVFPNSTGVPSLGAVSCLGTTPNPIWYYMQAEVTGNIDITMQQTSNGGGGLDVDFAVWGPFTSLSAGCGSPFPPGTPVDCSYSTAAIETANIPNAPAGQFYILLITNFSNQPGTITFSQTGGAGTTDCGILSNADNNGPICDGETLILNGDIQNAGNTTVQWFHLPDFTNPIGTSQTLTISPAGPGDAGDYAFIAFDNSTFEADTSYTTVVVNPIPAAPTFTSTSPACEGSTITLTPDNIIPGATYNWTGSNGYVSNQTVATFANATSLFNGTYTLVVTVYGCVSPPYSEPLSIYPTIIPLVTGPTEVCEGALVPLDVTNGSSFVSFSWNSVQGSDPQPVPAGTYVVAATDLNNCITSSAPFVVDLIQNPLNITGADEYCEGSTITLSATPGKQSYAWTTGSTQETTLVDTEEGAIIVNVVSVEGCERADTLIVKRYDKPTALFGPTKVCEGGTATFTNLTQLGDNYGSVQNSWGWYFGFADANGPVTSSAETPTQAFPQAGMYDITFVVGTNNGCVDTVTAPFLVVDPPHVDFSFESFCFGQGKFTNLTQAGNLPVENSTWEFGDNSAPLANNDVDVYHNYPSIDTYSATLTVTDTAGCISDTTIDITLKNTPLFNDIPNVITPNGDNVNDTYAFIPEVGECYNYTFTVFNRWGAKVFETEGATNKTFDGKSNLGSKLQDGVYFWVLIANGTGAGQGEEVIRKGNITIAGTK